MKLKIFLSCLAMLAPSLWAADPLSESERDEDRRLSPSLQPVKDDPSLPRVLLLGDSISMGYTVKVREALKGKANVHRAPTNCGSTVTGVSKLDAWLGEGKWDVIHFNFGLHDLKYLKPGRQNVSPTTYAKNLEKIVTRLQETGATLIWASTTPVPAEADRGYARVPEDVAKYNALAKTVMDKHHIEINDLYTLILPHVDKVRVPRDVHFRSEGSDIMTKQIAEKIEKALAARKAAADKK